jgi:hypothetical protein
LDYKAGRCIEIKSGANRSEVKLFWGGFGNIEKPKDKII